MKRRSPVYNTIRSQKNPPFSCTLLSPEYAFGKKIWVCHAVQCCKLQPTALYISAVVYNTTWFLLHLCAFGKKVSLSHSAGLQPAALYISAVVKWAAAPPVALSRCTQPHIALSHFQCFVTVMKYYSVTTAVFQFKCGHKGLLCHY